MCKNYIIKTKDNIDKLYYKRKIRKKDNNKYINYEEDFLIPTIEELNNLLYKFHTETCHSNYKELKAKFYENNWFLWNRFYF